MKIFDSTLARLERSLDVRLVRHNVLAGNAANVATPGFTPKDVDFEAAMRQAAQGEGGGGTGLGINATERGHMAESPGRAPEGIISLSSGKGEVPLIEGPSAAATPDGNRVDLDKTMTALAENSLQYNASARAAGKKLAILRYVASDGNG